jgi:hypothetical protein
MSHAEGPATINGPEAAAQARPPRPSRCARHNPNRLPLPWWGGPGLVKQLAALSGMGLWQVGEGEATFVFDVVRFKSVAAVVRPRKRRRLPEGQRRACVRRLARARPPAPT